MSRRRVKNENVRNIQQAGKGKSYYVTIPIAIMQNLGWKKRQKVIVKQFGKGKIIISDWTE